MNWVLFWSIVAVALALIMVLVLRILIKGFRREIKILTRIFFWVSYIGLWIYILIDLFL